MVTRRSTRSSPLTTRTSRRSERAPGASASDTSDATSGPRSPILTVARVGPRGGRGVAAGDVAVVGEPEPSRDVHQVGAARVPPQAGHGAARAVHRDRQRGGARRPPAGGGAALRRRTAGPHPVAARRERRQVAHQHGQLAGREPLRRSGAAVRTDRAVAAAAQLGGHQHQVGARPGRRVEHVERPGHGAAPGGERPRRERARQAVGLQRERLLVRATAPPRWARPASRRWPPHPRCARPTAPRRATPRVAVAGGEPRGIEHRPQRARPAPAGSTRARASAVSRAVDATPSSQ